MARQNHKHGSGIGDWVKALLFAVVVSFIVKTSIAEGYTIPSSSMENTLLIGDHIVADKISYGAKIPFTSFRLPALRPPRQGDIITFKWPGDRKTDYIKRCVAIAGQIVEIRDKILYVDGVSYPNPQFSKHTDARIFPPGIAVRDNFGPYRVPAGMIFAMGDNRDSSYDSRYWGSVPLDLVEGRLLFIQWSFAPDSSGSAIDLADLGSIPTAVWLKVTHFVDTIRWGRFLMKVN